MFKVLKDLFALLFIAALMYVVIRNAERKGSSLAWWLEGNAQLQFFIFVIVLVMIGGVIFAYFWKRLSNSETDETKEGD